MPQYGGRLFEEPELAAFLQSSEGAGFKTGTPNIGGEEYVGLGRCPEEISSGRGEARMTA